MKNFTGKRDKKHKEMREAEEELVKKIEGQNERINYLSWEIDKWKRKLADKNLVKKQTEEAMGMR